MSQATSQAMSQVRKIEFTAWRNKPSIYKVRQLTRELEEGKVLVLPQLNFIMKKSEVDLLHSTLVEQNRKNISYDINSGKLKGISKNNPSAGEEAKKLMHRYAENAQILIDGLLPHYQSTKIIGRTSLRVLDTGSNRPSSYRKDDSRLHVDAFPSTPTHGRRILRVFHNINPDDIPRVWRVGEPFANLIERFKPILTKPVLGSRVLMNLFNITKKYRTLYDHYMLQLHHKMKCDTCYQQSVSQEIINFMPGTTWLVYSDLVSHAAMSGQHMLEQTFYLEVKDQLYPELSPLKQLEERFRCKLL